MTISDYEFTSQLGLGVPFPGSRTRPKLLTPFGWFTVLVIVAVVTGAILGIAA